MMRLFLSLIFVCCSLNMAHAILHCKCLPLTQIGKAMSPLYCKEEGWAGFHWEVFFCLLKRSHYLYASPQIMVSYSQLLLSIGVRKKSVQTLLSIKIHFPKSTEWTF